MAEQTLPVCQQCSGELIRANGHVACLAHPFSHYQELGYNEERMLPVVENRKGWKILDRGANARRKRWEKEYLVITKHETTDEEGRPVIRATIEVADPGPSRKPKRARKHKPSTKSPELTVRHLRVYRDVLGIGYDGLRAEDRSQFDKAAKEYRQRGELGMALAAEHLATLIGGGDG